MNTLLKTEYALMQVVKISKRRPNISFGDSTKQIVPSSTFTHSKHMHHSFKTPYCIICSHPSLHLHSLTEATSTTNVSLRLTHPSYPSHPLTQYCNHRFDWFLVLLLKPFCVMLSKIPGFYNENILLILFSFSFL